MADIKDIKLGNTKYNIKIPSSRVKSMADYAKPSSKPSPEAIQQSDTLNAALGKLEYKADTNQTNILYVADSIGKNQLDTRLDALKAINTAGTWNGNVCTYSVGSVTVNSDGTLTVKKTSTASRLLFYLTENSGGSTPTSGTKYAGCVLSGCPSGGSENTYSQNGEQSQSPWGSVAAEYGNGYTIVTSSLPVYFYIVLNEAYTTPSEGLTFKPMICTAEAWNISHEFAPYAIPNSDLTYLEAEDRAALAEVVDSGAKNVYQVPVTIDNDAGLTITTNPSTGTITVSGTATKDRYIQISGNLSLYGTYIVQGCPSTGSSSTYYLHLEQSSKVGANDVGDKNYAGSTNTYNSASCKLYLRIFNGVAFGSGVTFTPIVCTKAAFCVSQKFVPYRFPIHGVMYDSRSVACSTTQEAYTGISFTASERGVYRITVCAMYSNSQPVGLRIKQRGSPTSTEYTFVYVKGDSNTATLTATGVMEISSAGGGFAVYAEYSGATYNMFNTLVEKIG